MKIGVDIGGTNIKAGLIANGEIIKKIKLKTLKTKEKVIDQITFIIDLLNDKNVDFIGIGCPGPADYKKGIIGRTMNIQLEGVNLKQIISRKFKKKVVMDNDANCFAIGEAKRLKAKNLIGLTLGSGVGGGIIIDGKLYRGKGNAGELGHCTIKFDGASGMNQGEIESYVSVKAIKRDYKKEPEKLKDKKAWNQIGEKLGIGIANIVNAFDPDIVVLGGGISKAFGLFKKGMQKEIDKRAVSKVKVIVGSEDSGIIGAASLY
jgi:glucokinase